MTNEEKCIRTLAKLNREITYIDVMIDHFKSLKENANKENTALMISIMDALKSINNFRDILVGHREVFKNKVGIVTIPVRHKKHLTLIK